MRAEGRKGVFHDNHTAKACPGRPVQSLPAAGDSAACDPLESTIILQRGAVHQEVPVEMDTASTETAKRGLARNSAFARA